MKIVLSGPPRSGKSCLREGLKQAIRRLDGAPYPYVITACPDGEGAWFQETVSSNPELAASCKRSYKAKFTEAFVERMSASVERCELPLTLVDIGGIPSEENRRICRTATGAVILAGDPGRVPEWKAFWKSLGVPVVAVIHSDYNGVADEVTELSPVLRARVHHLERGEDLKERPAIVALARFLVGMAAACS